MPSRRTPRSASRRASRVAETPVPERTAAPRTVALFDTNVLLDVVLARKPWVDVATAVLDAAARGIVRGYVAGHALTTIHYIVERERGRNVAATAVSDLLEIVDVVELGSDDFRRALALELTDFEDAVQVAACLRAGAQVLVTRNVRDFKDAPVPIQTPAELLALLGDTTPAE
ncbi:MAG: type II toxin-antitoxin system VapC family toxin [Gemmatimonadaceae bacterium]